MKNLKLVLSIQFLCSVLLFSPHSYSFTTTNDNQTVQASSAYQYVIGDLLELHADKIVTNRGTYKTTYIQVLDQRSPKVDGTGTALGITIGKVQLKFDENKQLLEVILY